MHAGRTSTKDKLMWKLAWPDGRNRRLVKPRVLQYAIAGPWEVDCQPINLIYSLKSTVHLVKLTLALPIICQSNL